LSGSPLTSLRLVRFNYAVRAGAFAWCFLTLGVHLWEHRAGGGAWALLVFQFLVYPHLVYWRALRSAIPRRAELDNLLVDSTLIGGWSAYLGFPTWIAYALIGSTMLNAAINRGAPGLVWSLVCSAAGALLWVLIGGFDYRPATSGPVSALCVLGSLFYGASVGWSIHRKQRQLRAASAELRESEERYRLIAENAGDLIAMVDGDGRWLYTSPSYRRLFTEADLAAGADAFAHVHPDDAEQSRRAVLRVLATGRSHEIALRLVDREGRVRQYRTYVQAVNDASVSGAAAPPRVLLVSLDVTDLRASEERLILAAHALEGMTEAIMITSADGTVVTVNRAFCELTGWKRDDVLGQPEKAVRNALQPPEFYDELYATVRREGYWSGTTWSRRANGSVYREWRSVRAVKDDAGHVTHYVTVFYEVGSKARPANAETAS
jgi:PAS domain S-box-containing protein